MGSGSPEPRPPQARGSLLGEPDPARLAGSCGSLRQTEHVGAFRMLGAAPAFVGRQRAIRINLSLETLQELLARWAGPGAPIDSATP